MSPSPASGGMPTTDPGAITERRIAWLTLAIGALAAGITGIAYSWDWAIGLMIGAGLAWCNFVWLAKGMDALVAASTAQNDAAQPRVPAGTYFRAAFRYFLIALSVYVIFKVLHIPLMSMILGLCALGAAAVVASVYEVWHPGKESGEIDGAPSADYETWKNT